MTIIPKTHPDDPADAITSLWLSILYILTVTAFSWYIILVVWLFISSPDWQDPDPTLITDIIPYDVSDILDRSSGSIGIFSHLMLCVILPLQLPGWWAIWKTSRTLQSLPGKTKHLSLVVLQRVAWAAAVAYLWLIIGIGVAVCGFEIYLAILNPQFTWIKPENAGITDTFWMIGETLRLLTMIVLIQLPGWWGLWFLNRPTSPLPIPNDLRWQRWRKGATLYLWGSTAITMIIITIRVGFFLYDEFLAPGHVFKIFDMDLVEFFFLVFFVLLVVSGAILYVMSVILLVQSPGWLVMAWLEKWRRQAAGIPKPHIRPLRLLQGVAIGYLTMVITARITWWFRLEYVDNHDFEDAFTPDLTPVLDALLWAQIPGWIALCLWLAWWLNQSRKQLVS